MNVEIPVVQGGGAVVRIQTDADGVNPPNVVEVTLSEIPKPIGDPPRYRLAVVAGCTMDEPNEFDPDDESVGLKVILKTELGPSFELVD